MTSHDTAYSVEQIECAQCSETWDISSLNSDDLTRYASAHARETFHDMSVVIRFGLDSILMAIDGIDPEDIVGNLGEPDMPEGLDDADDDEELWRFDDQGQATLLLTLAPPAPLGFFAKALEAIADMAPETSVAVPTSRGYELWSRSPTEEDRRRELGPLAFG